MSNAQPSRQVLEQRLRNRIITYLEVVVEFEDYHPPFSMNELMNQWEDYVGIEHPVDPMRYREPTSTSEEREAALAVNANWEALSAATPQTITNEVAVLRTAEWREFLSVCSWALGRLRLRGPLSEDEEYP
jgi:hypothetical protein